MEALSVLPQHTLVVGDMPMDIEMGKRAGACTCGVTYGNASAQTLLSAGADYVVDAMEEILDLI